MQPQQSSRIDLLDLKTQILKRIGVDRSKKYFYYLNRFLCQKLNKSEFDKSCFQLLGRENLPLHNQLIRSILKNACQVKIPPPIYNAGPTKSIIQNAKHSPGTEEGLEKSGSLVPSQNHNVPIWSNGVLPVSPRKVRSGIRDRKPKDRHSLLGPDGIVECVPHLSTGREDTVTKIMENGELHPCDYQRPIQHLQTLAEQPVNEREGLLHCPTGTPEAYGKDQARFVEDGEEVEHAKLLSVSRSPLLAPLGIPFLSASVGGARKATPLASSDGFVSYYDIGGLSDTEMLRKRMEQIAFTQGLGGVSMECANTLNSMLDVYLKRLVRSCVDLVGARSLHDRLKHPVHKQLVQGKVMNGIWPSNHLHGQTGSGLSEAMQDQRAYCSISLLDFKVAMQLNPQQLGDDWPLLLEKICTHAMDH